MKHLLKKLARDQAGATALEWCLLLAVIVLPAYALIRVSLDLLTTHYRLIVTINGLPFP